MLKYNLDILDKSKWVMGTTPEAARLLPFYITEAGEFFAGEDYFTERDGRDGYQLIYTASGSGRFIADNKEIKLEAGSAVIIRCNERHRYETYKSGWHNLWIHFDGCGAKGFESLINGDEYVAVYTADKEELETALTTIITMAHRTDMLSCALISDSVSKIMTALLTQRLTKALQSDGSNGGETKYPEIHSVLEFIHKNYALSITIDDMVRDINISKYHFIRIFKRQMGVTPYEYLTDYRMKMAKILLRTTYKSIFEISDEVGYKSKSNFISKFRDLNGVTPAQYRKENISLSSASS